MTRLDDNITKLVDVPKTTIYNPPTSLLADNSSNITRANSKRGKPSNATVLGVASPCRAVASSVAKRGKKRMLKRASN